ncbi:MAG TPA: FAD-dependent monooxygenase, partial [Acidobacteriaceae bacterium]|nr:FAD-dependent monooxygenase [Acidobacteriaceae bacterium]
MNSPTSPVLIVGAGPVGLTTALLLARQGIRSTVLQRGSDVLRTGSRAIVLLRDTLEAFDAAAPGTGARLAARGITWRVKRTYHKDRLLFSETYPESKDARYPLFVNVSQQETDSALLDAARTQYPDHISVVFDQHVTGLRQTERHVVVVTEEGREFVADFVVGADGA